MGRASTEHGGGRSGATWRSLGVLAVLALGSAGCGDDDGAGSDAGPDASGGGVGGTAGSGGGGVGGTGLPRDDGGGVPAGTGEEGDLCRRASDCGGELICVDSGFEVGVCARGCASDGDCGTDVCLSRTNFEADLHCENVERAEFSLCGAAATAICAESFTCLISPDVPVLGVCVRICLVEDDSDGGAASAGDAGAAFASCRGEQSCIDISFQSEPDGNVGICAEEVDIGDECGIEMGALCQEVDVCAPEDPIADETDYFCREDCFDDGECSEGNCVDVRGEYAYCMP
jgi:hypothetical protein